MVKKAQITIFILIGLLLIGSVSLVFIIDKSKETGNSIENQITFKSETDIVEYNIKSCMDDVIKRNLRLFGAQGGALMFGLSSGPINIPIRTYYDKGKISIPSIESLEQDFETVIENIIPYCSDTSYPGFTVEETGNPAASVIFGEKDIVVRLDYNIEVAARTKDEKVTIKKFEFTYPIAFTQYLKTAEEIINKIDTEPEWVDITFLGDIEYGVAVEPQSENNVVYTISDQYGANENDIFYLSFNTEFETPDQPFNREPLFVNLEDQYTVSLSEEIAEDINGLDPENDQLFYYLESEIDISIDEITGFLSYKPSEEDIGSHEVEIFVDDGKGKWTNKLVTITVLP